MRSPVTRLKKEVLGARVWLGSWHEGSFMGAPGLLCCPTPCDEAGWMWSDGSPGGGAGSWGGPLACALRLLSLRPAPAARTALLGPAASHVSGKPTFLSSQRRTLRFPASGTSCPKHLRTLCPAFYPGLWDLGGRKRCDRKPFVCGRGF